jgi:hypothetical protein
MKTPDLPPLLPVIPFESVLSMLTSIRAETARAAEALTEELAVLNAQIHALDIALKAMRAHELVAHRHD